MKTTRNKLQKLWFDPTLLDMIDLELASHWRVSLLRRQKAGRLHGAKAFGHCRT